MRKVDEHGLAFAKAGHLDTELFSSFSEAIEQRLRMEWSDFNHRISRIPPGLLQRLAIWMSLFTSSRLSETLAMTLTLRICEHDVGFAAGTV